MSRIRTAGLSRSEAGGDRSQRFDHEGDVGVEIGWPNFPLRLENFIPVDGSGENPLLLLLANCLGSTRRATLLGRTRGRRDETAELIHGEEATGISVSQRLRCTSVPIIAPGARLPDTAGQQDLRTAPDVVFRVGPTSRSAKIGRKADNPHSSCPPESAGVSPHRRLDRQSMLPELSVFVYSQRSSQAVAQTVIGGPCFPPLGILTRVGIVATDGGRM